jgi:transcriptional regulator with XRE-family HTH domain
MIGKTLKYIREKKGYSLRKLAEKAGLSHSFISDIEHGRSNPSIKKLLVIAEALSICPELLLLDEVAVKDHMINYGGRDDRQCS